MKKILFISLFAVSFIPAVCQPLLGPKRMPDDAFAFDYFERHIYLDMMFNDTVPGQWLFDTGAETVYPDSTEFSAYPFRSKSYRRFRGGGENIVVLPVVLDSISVGNEHLRVVTAQSPLLDLKKILGKKPSGIVGLEMVRDVVVEINYYGSYMRLQDRAEGVPEGYTPVALESSHGKFFLLPLEIKLQNGEVFRGRFIYDTGYGGALSINTSAAMNWGLSEKVRYKVEQYTEESGVGGQSREYVFRPAAVTIAGHDIHSPIVEYSLNTGGVKAAEEYDGIAGNALLEQFDNILDLAAGVLYIKRGRNYRKPFVERLGGFRAIDRSDIYNGFLVISMDIGGAAEKAGLRIGDVITHMDGVRLSERNAYHFNDMICRPSAGYELRVMRGDSTLAIRIVNGIPYL